MPPPRFDQSISVVLPAFDEEDCIGRAMAECVEFLDLCFPEWEILVVDDGSRDDTSAVVSEAGEAEPRIKLIVHGENRGYGAAIRSGFDAAVGELVFFTDADCQFEVSEIRDLMPLLDHADVVLGFRVYRYDTVLRCILSWIYNRLVGVLFLVRVRDVDCSFKLFTRQVVDRLELQSTDFFVDTEMVARCSKMGARIVEKGVRHHPRRAGHTTVRASHIPRTLWTVFRMWFKIQFSRATKLPRVGQ